MWSSTAVNGRRSSIAPDWRKLAAVGHRHVIGAAASPRQLGHREPVLLADRNGTVSMWETFGVRLSDPLPPDLAHREVTGIAVLPGTGDSIVVVTVSRPDRNLRIWEPLHGIVTLVPLSIRPRCLISAGDALGSGTTTESWRSPSPSVPSKAHSSLRHGFSKARTIADRVSHADPPVQRGTDGPRNRTS